jgi:hypothetical protein
MLNEGNAGVDGDGLYPSSAALTDRPIDNKKVKAERNGASSLARIDASIDKMMASFSSTNKESDERSDAMWKAMLAKQDVKLGLEKEKVEATKLEAQTGMIKATNEASHVALAKMMEEAKNLTVDLSAMDPLARAWYEMYCERISKEVMTASVASATATPAPTPVVMEVPPPSI